MVGQQKAGLRLVLSRGTCQFSYERVTSSVSRQLLGVLGRHSVHRAAAGKVRSRDDEKRGKRACHFPADTAARKMEQEAYLGQGQGMID